MTAMSRTELLNYRRKHGLCARCGRPLNPKERSYEGVGGSYVRCDECARAVVASPEAQR